MDRFPDLFVLQIGASPNLQAEVQGDPWHSNCASTRILDRLPGDQLLQLGVRHGTKDKFSEMKTDDRIIEISDLKERVQTNGIYLNLQLDAFDPSFVHATGTLEQGGWYWNEFKKLIAAVPWDQVRGVEISGLIPERDESAYSSLMAAKAVREIMLSLGKWPSSSSLSLLTWVSFKVDINRRLPAS